MDIGHTENEKVPSGDIPWYEKIRQIKVESDQPESEQVGLWGAFGIILEAFSKDPKGFLTAWQATNERILRESVPMHGSDELRASLMDRFCRLASEHPEAFEAMRNIPREAIK